MKNFLQQVHQSKRIAYIFIIGLLVQLVYCITSVGYFHPDQHFQVIEFSSLQLHLPNAAGAVWELESSIRPTLQVYIFTGFRSLCHWISIDNPFTILTLLRVFQGILFYIVLNAIVLWYYKNRTERTIATVLFLLNFSWILIYTRTLFSSETLSAIVFFPSIVYFHKQYLERNLNFIKCLLIGFFIAIAFYLRFQIGFAIIGFGIWIFFLEKQFKYSLQILLGFCFGIALNVFLDYEFYHKLVFTPYLYFKVNLLQGVAASFGEKSFTYYLFILMAIVLAPFISIVLFYQFIKTSLLKLKHPLVLSTLLFILGHCLVGHKEERFMFSIFSIIPIIIGFNDNAFSFLDADNKWRKIVKPIVVFSLVLNFVLLILFIFTPYSQSIHFIGKMNNQFKEKQVKVYCYERTPLQTESHLPLTYYSSALSNVQFVETKNIDSISKLNEGTIWVTSTFNDIQDNFGKLDSLGCKQQLYSSSMLWNINLFLKQKKMNTVNDIWVLYKLEKSK
ncbi:MAG: hypothetical protein ACOVO1_03210 [Chitinophagaceae bacterium]